ncbi:cysteine desulfurase family protein [Polymorphum gilvum]|uniref:Cysteine desulfurase n=1 Tax=Polymorphum gilvum (strain LMG 25793 / CGMCC 1.9160 / SL003B-26A1) TaxID=991905 RepID=F2J0V3_POLGS|nr:cysteine desulfurase family protein [Polymorphum gilvum]ADZ70789.1 Aminotransferase class V [Polymorphum gilvum SL003B-26A1]
MTSDRPHLYLDYNAGAPLRPQVRACVIDCLQETGNASSVHAPGRRARGRIEDAREAVARLCGTSARGVIFTSGGTEANVTALTPEWQGGDGPLYLNRLLCTATEHPSVLAGGRFPASQVATVPVDADGVVRLDALEALLAEGGPALVSVMAANNETGVLQPLEQIGALVKAAGGIFHVDAVQAAGRIALDLATWQVDAISLSAHKLGGPQGAGALVLKRAGVAPKPLLTGGGQEGRRRAGTENVAALAGFGVAATSAAADLVDMDRLRDLTGLLETGLRHICPQTVVFSQRARRLANTTCFALPGVAAETALIACDLAGASVSSGAACSSGKVAASHVLTAMGVDEETARCALRISLGWGSDRADVTRFLEIFADLAGRLVPRSRGCAA